MSILHHWGTVARLAPSCDVIVPEVPVPEVPVPAFAAARLLWLARFFLFLPAFFPVPGAGEGAGFDCVERIIVVSVAMACCCDLRFAMVAIAVEKLTKSDNLSIFWVIESESTWL
jgi:hypothetical protein